ncbi:uncharacterized protein LOC111290241 [Durio zibethinus]|uniref:Uncharacterized protein LOC111290241 n=1 Tax=Durio zibethinus TaxID=66656 RepID=A0A6P5YA25_DURZI|nr:uncharacterized protein LOC111290241 [Durio zibethinus]
MGGCASKPKEYDIPEKPQLGTAAQDNTNGGETQTEKPLVDLSESDKTAQGSSSEPEGAASEPVSAETVAETAKPTEEDVKASTNIAEDKVEVTDNTTVLPVKEAEAAHNSNAAPSKEEVKSDAPLVPL